jgi:conjugal transfer pilin signal peptidase TrbI
MSISSNPRARLTPALLRQRCARFAPLLLGHCKTHLSGWLFAGLAFYLFQANYSIGYNATPSLPFKLFLIHYREPVRDGDYIAFRWHGGKPYPDGMVFAKRVAGTAGDTVFREGRRFTVNGQAFAAKEVGMTGRPLNPANLPEGRSVIPQGKHWVMGTHEFSLDSRYDLVGLVGQENVVGRAYPIF